MEGNTWDTNIIGNTISRNSSTVVNPNRVGDTGEPIEWASGTQLKSVEGILKANFAEIMDEGVWGLRQGEYGDAYYINSKTKLREPAIYGMRIQNPLRDKLLKKLKLIWMNLIMI